MPSALWWRCLTPVGTQATGTPRVSVIYHVELPLAYAVCTKPNLPQHFSDQENLRPKNTATKKLRKQHDYFDVKKEYVKFRKFS
jgi:hypothetical protein